ncbi:MAG: SIS domain-containing protein [Ktedonobacteraceae bacterium]|nr:SIS domain-containing protein [Ktedonobacteraceae bacterium]
MLSHEEQQLILTPLSQPASPVTSYHNAVVTALAERRVAWDAALTELMARTRTLTETTRLLVETLRTGHKVLVAGNGGSAAEAQHFSGELVGRFKRERAAYAVMALTTDTSIITAVANDYGFQDIFARQVQAFGQPGDLFIAFSTSGESENIVRAAALGLRRGMKVVAVTGAQPSRLERLATVTIRVPTVDTPTVQELHMAITHILCDITEAELAAWEGDAC